MSEALAAFHFLRPAWVLALLPAAWLAWRMYRANSAGGGWRRVIDPALLAVQTTGMPSRSRRLLNGLVPLGLVIAVVALAGPAWERLPQPVEKKRDALVIVLDLSLSMFAEDVAPSRLVRARQKIIDVLRSREEGVTALVCYAGDAHTVAPLTDDTDTIENLLAALHPAMMPKLGSEVDPALELARGLLQNAGVPEGRILLVTDGVDRINDVTRHADPAFPISVIGVGTADGAPIPLDFVNQPGRQLRDEDNDLVIARLDDERLREIADISYGQYARLSLDDSDLTTTLPVERLSEDVERLEREFDAWADAGPYLALLLLPLLLLAFRRGTLAGLVLATGLVSSDLQAGLWDDLWQRRDQQAQRALDGGQPERAVELFQDPDWQAAARYRVGEYAAAGEHFGSRGDADGFYNLGNSLAHSGDLQGAIAAYDQALAMAPDHADAAHNKAIVEQAQQQQQGEAGDQDNNEQQQNSDNEQSDQQREQNSEQGDGEQQQEPDDGQQGEQDPGTEQQPAPPEDPQAGEEQTPEDEQPAAEEATDEQRAAMEQWLRRVPDDPGGLLRRKFEHETQQRLRRGESRRQSEKIW